MTAVKTPHREEEGRSPEIILEPALGENFVKEHECYSILRLFFNTLCDFLAGIHAVLLVQF